MPGQAGGGFEVASVVERRGVIVQIDELGPLGPCLPHGLRTPAPRDERFASAGGYRVTTIAGAASSCLHNADAGIIRRPERDHAESGYMPPPPCSRIDDTGP